MSHPHRYWRSRWIVDLAARTATHRDGWTFQFAAEADAEGGIDGQCTAHPPLVGYNMKALSQTGARIAREAGEIYLEKLRER